MSYATGTTHYNLPQTVGTDKRDWADTNQAFSDLDAAVYGAVSDVATAGTAISGLETRMTTAEGNISDNAANITSLDTRMTTAEGAITSLSSRVDDVGNDLGDMICAYNELTATSTHAYDIGDYFRYNDVLYRATQQIAIGDTIVPDTNCTTTNVTTELLNLPDIPDISEYAKNNILTYVEDTLTASRAYTVGDYIIHEGNLLRVTANISNGGAITIGTNVEEDILASGRHLINIYDGPAIRNSLLAHTVLNFLDTLPLNKRFDAKIVLNESLVYNVTEYGSNACFSRVAASFSATQINIAAYLRDSASNTHCYEWNSTSGAATDSTATEVFTRIDILI